jgi:hypothetical protein
MVRIADAAFSRGDTEAFAPTPRRDTAQAMSQENIQRAERGVLAVNETYRTGDLAPWRRHVEEVFDPGVALETEGDAFTEGGWQGHDGAVGFVANQMEVLESMWLRADEFIDVDQDCFIVAISFGGRARHTGIPVELHPFHVFGLRNGLIRRWQIFQARQAALEAAGLSE